MPSIPDFKPDIPVYLLDKCSESEKYVIETLAVLNKKTDWQSQELGRQAEVSAGILEQTKKTNGRLLKAETDITTLQTDFAHTKQDIQLVDTVLKVLKTKWFWIVFLSASAIFFLGALPWVYANHITLHQLISLVLRFVS